MATRGGYGLTRLLDRIDWKRIAQSVERGTRWVGHSDLTALQLGLLAHAGGGVTWAGPLACDDFGRERRRRAASTTSPQDCFVEAMSGELEAVGFRTDAGFDGLRGARHAVGRQPLRASARCSARRTGRSVKGGILFLEDVNEHPYRIERNLLQLQQAGVLDAQKAVCSAPSATGSKSPLDRGYTLKTAIAQLRAATQDADPHRPAVRPRADQGDAAGRRAGAAAGRRARRVDRLVSGRAASAQAPV